MKGVGSWKISPMVPIHILPADEEPDLWFHDLLQSNGTPYIQIEIDAIQEFVEQ